MENTANHPESEENLISEVEHNAANLNLDKAKISQLILIIMAALKKPRDVRKQTARKLKMSWKHYRWIEEKCTRQLQQKT